MCIEGGDADYIEGVDDVIERGPKEYNLHVVGLLLHTAAQIVLTLLPPAMGARFYRFLGRPARWTCWLAGAAAIKSG